MDSALRPSELPAELDYCTASTTPSECASDEITALLSIISICVATGSKGLSDGQRRAVLDATSQLQKAMERPEEGIFRIMSAPTDATAFGLAAHLNLFDIAARHTSAMGEAIPLSKLADLSRCDPDLLLRIVRFLVGHGLLAEVTAGCYQITEAGRSLRNDQPLGSIVLFMSAGLLSLGNMFQYFGEHGYRNPCDVKRGPWQDAHASEDSFFQWLESRPREKTAFHRAMASMQLSMECQWFNHFPVERRLSVEGGRVSLVDLGGGMGHDTKRLLDRYPGLKDTLRVVDLPSVVKDAPVQAGIQFVGHDFFHPYPAGLQGAKAYYMRMILHDWPETQARAILANVREAMSADSVLLINEIVLAEQAVSVYEARLDFLMMAFCAAMERTESQWTSLLKDAGFVIRAIWSCGSMSLIEAVLDSA